MIDCGCIWSDVQMIARGLANLNIGISDIKERRRKLQVHCNPGTKVGEYVPFYFCPRSIMLYILHCKNHKDLKYTGGQQPILHLESKLKVVVQWAEANQKPWAFSTRNAGTHYADFYNDLRDLYRINWSAVSATDFRDATIKEGKQAEFLLFESFPLTFVDRVGVFDSQVEQQIESLFEGTKYNPVVVVQRNWYY
ncbi:glr3370 [Gloeobacter violaceus PCC 7421]|uniref:Glr3370 protein n=2 Tax=Gloeobacter violaceus TaxID=33072 RepID=Q7NG04_GLOVI|nr:glr3370 [Gloeobacter violaceus PCC 7421]